jgi:hypothetical protein
LPRGLPALLFFRLNHDFPFLTFCSSACMVSLPHIPPPHHSHLIIKLAPGSRGSASLQLIRFPPFIPHHSLLPKKKSTLFLFLNLYLNVAQAPLLLPLSCWLMQRRLLLLTKLPTALLNLCFKNLSSFLQLPTGVLESIPRTIPTLNVLYWVYLSVSKVYNPPVVYHHSWTKKIHRSRHGRHQRS